jgi:hypothetical protein
MQAKWDEAMEGTKRLARDAEDARMDALGTFRRAQTDMTAAREAMLTKRSNPRDDEATARWR